MLNVICHWCGNTDSITDYSHLVNLADQSTIPCVICDEDAYLEPVDASSTRYVGIDFNMHGAQLEDEVRDQIARQKAGYFYEGDAKDGRLYKAPGWPS